MKKPTARAGSTRNPDTITDSVCGGPAVETGVVTLQKLFVVNLHDTKTHFATTFKTHSQESLLRYFASVDLKKFYVSISYGETPIS